MAHHLARLIDAANTASLEERDDAEDRCFAAILEVWRHRNCLPRGRRPFEPAEPLLNVIAALDPDAPRPFYNRVAMDWGDLDDVDNDGSESMEANPLDVIKEFDRVARTVLRDLLARAARDLPAATQEWLKKAQAAGLTGSEVAAIRRILFNSGDVEDVERQRRDERVDALRSQLDDLHRFVTTAEIVRGEIEDLLAVAKTESQAEGASAKGIEEKKG
ncbi:hypothetical protein [Sphingomonas sp. Leaf205]|uniref:hypothetical protein n=1 Tax=Sphingomonas sp. Leaf205 TaxID=2876551 RepID=UPI001E303A8F|nr:hypothetical protein [Sphingomonas sp. Leaf205]